jgi:hypothetical protein
MVLLAISFTVIADQICSQLQGWRSQTLLFHSHWKSHGRCVQPFDVVRTRMQADSMNGLMRSMLPTFRVIVKEQGVGALWQGTSATVTRMALGVGAHFFFLESLKPFFETQTDTGPRLTTSGAAMCGMTPSLVSWS